MIIRARLILNWRLVAMTLRAAVWRKTVEPPLLGAGSLVGWVLVALSVELMLSLVNAGDTPRFDIYGLDALVAWRATLLLVGVFFTPAAWRATVLSASLALSSLVGLIGVAAPFALSRLPTVDLEKVWGIEARYSSGAFTAIYVIWAFGAIFALFRSVVATRRGSFFRALGYFVATFAVTHFFPHLPVFAPPDYQIASANIWEAKRAAAVEQVERQRPRIDGGQLALAQSALLDAATSRLLPQRNGVTGIYTIGIAGYSREDVFIKELNGGLNALAQALPIEGRAMRLVNHFSLLNALPLASVQNFGAAVHAVAHIMNREEDILLLFMTSHGTPDGFVLAMEEVGVSTLRPDQVASLLDAEGIRNRIIIVSACFSGAFVKPLMNDNTIVLTASDENSTSFGCSNERDWTYFGDALFNHTLRPGKTLQQAFDEAKQMIAGWEAENKLPPSNPQGSFGAALVAKLQPLYLQESASPFPAVPGPARDDAAAKK
jgi:peptidase C13-like protein